MERAAADPAARIYAFGQRWGPEATTRDSIRVLLRAPVALGNRGGLISLLDVDGLMVDGVAYTKAQAEREGWSLVWGGGALTR